MPIRLNLLAEAQAQEDFRRRDPVKRAIYIGIFAVVVGLVWSSSLQLKALIAKGQLSSIEAQISQHTNAYSAVLENQKRLADTHHKLVSIRMLATNRFLHGTVMNELQLTTIEDVHLLRYKSEQLYTLNEATKPKTNVNSVVVAGKPATVTERVLLALDGRDSAATPGDQVVKFKQGIAESKYFLASLGNTNEVRLASLSPPKTEGYPKPYVLFTLECRYPEKTR